MNKNLNINDFNLLSESQENAASYVIPEKVMNNLLNKRYSIILTDDHVPVDNLLASVFEERFNYYR